MEELRDRKNRSRQETERTDMQVRPWLGTAPATLGILKKHNIRIKKKYGQNFLIDGNALEQIAAAAGITKEDLVLEIGPGIGTLTQYLAFAAREVIAVEIDTSLQPVLADTLVGCDNVTVLFQDILKTDIAAIAEEKNGGKPIKVVSNLPYYITTPIILSLLESHVPVSSMTFMVQKEVADRMAASPGGKDYGALTLAVQYYCSIQKNLDVPPSCFIPRPEVTSSVVTLTSREEKTPVRSEEQLFRVIRAAFSMRRKTLVNCLAASAEIPLGKEEAKSLLEEEGLDPNIRGEALSLEQFARLSDRIGE